MKFPLKNIRSKQCSATIRLGVMIMFSFFLVGNVSAFVIDDKLSYNPTTKEYLVKNLFGFGKDIVKIELKTPQIYSVPVGYNKVAEMQITNYDDYFGVIEDMQFYEIDKGMREFTRSFDYKYKSIVNKTVKDYKRTCATISDSSGHKLCNETEIGSHIEQVEVWLPLYRNNFVKGENITIGVFTDVKKGDNVEWIITAYGKRLDAWATWTANLNVGILAYYNFNEASGSLVNVVDGIWNGSVTSITAREIANQGSPNGINKGYKFGGSGSGDRIDIANNGSGKSPAGSPKGTISFWFNATFNSDDAPAFRPALAGTDGEIFSVLFDGTNDKFQFLIGAVEVLNVPEAGNNWFDAGDWVNLVVTWDDSTEVTKLYINGTLNATGSNAFVGSASTNLDIGDMRGLGRVWPGVISEVGIWDRVLNLTEITDLYNAGEGISFTTAFAPSIVLNVPANNSGQVNVSILFNCSGLQAEGSVLNLSLIVDGVVNTTIFNTTSPQNLSLQTTLTLTEGSHNWTCRAFNSDDVSTTGQLRVFSIDSQPPLINVTSPRETFGFGFVGQNLTLNWSVIDLNLQACWFEYNLTNTTVTCADNNFSFISTIQKNLTFYANDTSGNEGSNFTLWDFQLLEINQSFVSPVTEGTIQTFNISVLTNGSTLTIAQLNYNVTTLEIGSIVDKGNNNFFASATIVIPNQATTSNVSFFWAFSTSDGFLANSTTQNQSINALTIDDCSVNTVLLLNYTLRDEETQVFLNGTAENSSIEVDLDIFPVGSTIRLLNFSQNYSQTNPAQVCLNINLTDDFTMDVETLYTGTRYSSEFHHLQNFSLTNASIPQNINLFDLLTVDTTEFQITFKDSDFLPVEGAIIDIARKYVADGLFKSVEIPITDSNGQTVAHLVEKDVVYNMIVSKNGLVLGSFNNIIAFCEDVVAESCFITLNAQASNTEVFNYDTQVGLAFLFAYNETSRVIDFTFSTTGGGVKNVTLIATQLDQLGNNTVCTESLITSSGVLSCTIPPAVGNSTVIVNIFVDGKLKIINYIDAGREFDIGDVGYFLAFFLILSLALMMTDSKIGVVIGVLLGFISSILFSFIEGSLIGVGGSFIWLVIAGIILAWKLNKENTT